MSPSGGQVESVHTDDAHRFSKPSAARIRLLAGLGVEGDAHCGVTVQHRSRVARDPSQPNLRQVHLIAAELHDELRDRGFHVGPGDMGENVLTRGVDLLGLPTGARLQLGAEAVIEITGLRNPCYQLDTFEDGLMKAVLGRSADGDVVRRAGVMAVVLTGGEVRPGDPIGIEPPQGAPIPLQPV
jgi:MOSC domain-containing protein YiiM